MATKDFTMPKLAMGMNQGTINNWLIKTGDKVNKGQEIATVETEKVVYDLISPHDGYLQLLIDEGETVDVDSKIAVFADTLAELSVSTDENKAKITTSSEQDYSTQTCAAVDVAKEIATSLTAKTNKRIIASPLARKLAQDHALNLAKITGTGPNGRIVKRDIVSHIAAQKAIPTSYQNKQSQNVNSLEPLSTIAMQGKRQSIAEHMRKSLQTTAQLSSFWESDISQLLVMRQAFIERENTYNTRVSLNAFIIKAICCAIKQVPIVNAHLVGQNIIINQHINIGIAIAITDEKTQENSLVVGVIPNVENMGIVDIDKKMKQLVIDVRHDNASPEQLTGSTITLSSTAGIAPPGSSSTPILNLPNASLVATSTMIKKPVVVNDEIEIRTMMPLSFTFDHCLYDGETAARFMKALHDVLEKPELMLKN